MRGVNNFEQIMPLDKVISSSWFFSVYLRGLDNKRSENGVGMNVNDIFRGAERIEITWPIACR